MTTSIRSLSADEWRVYRDVRLRALQDAPEAFGGSYEAAAACPDQQWIDWCGQPSWFAFDGPRPVGMVRVFPRDDNDLPELVSMWVAPEVRGTDAAGRLVQCVLQWAAAVGEAGVHLHVMAENARAARLYERLGFVRTGITEVLPVGRTEVEWEHRFDVNA